MVYIIDIDGTISDNTHRKHFIDKAVRRWDFFYAPDVVLKDPPIAEALRAMKTIITSGHPFHFLTGRPETTRECTTEWLRVHVGVAPHNPKADVIPSGPRLYMRSNGDFRPAVFYKEHRLKKLLGDVNPTGQPVVFIDDDERNEKMYGDYGYWMRAPDCWKEFK